MNGWSQLLERTYDVVRVPVAQLGDAVLERRTPCSQWNVHDLFEHVVGTVDMFTAAAGGSLPDPSTTDDPLKRFDAAVDRNLVAWGALTDPTVTLSLSFGDFPAEAAARLNQMEALVHGWDLAASLGLSLRWPADVAETAMQTAETRFRTRPRGTAFGPEAPARGNGIQDKLIALTGRDTASWQGRNSAGASVKHMYAKLPAQDVSRARQFYEDKMGFTPFAENHGHLYYEVDGAHFLLFPSSGRASGTHDQVGFVVDDLQTEITRLTEAGVHFEIYDIPGMTMRGEVMDAGAMQAAWFKDSEGNLISLNEFVGGSPFDR